MLDFRRYRNFSRILFKINIGLSLILLGTQIATYVLLIRNPAMKYYIQTNTGFIYPIKPVHPQNPHNEVIVTHFE